MQNINFFHLQVVETAIVPVSAPVAVAASQHPRSKLPVVTADRAAAAYVR
jgi:hypothetical protein